MTLRCGGTCRRLYLSRNQIFVRAVPISSPSLPDLAHPSDGKLPVKGALRHTGAEQTMVCAVSSV